MTTTFNPTGFEGSIVNHPADCDGQDGLCADYGCYDYVETGVNVSRANFQSIMVALQLDAGTEYGTIDATDLKGRCLMALALADDTALPGSDDKAPGSARFIDCGRREGYMTDRLTALLEVAEQAISLGVTVSFA